MKQILSQESCFKRQFFANLHTSSLLLFNGNERYKYGVLFFQDTFNFILVSCLSLSNGTVLTEKTFKLLVTFQTENRYVSPVK